MKVELIPGTELSDDLRKIWDCFQMGNPFLSSAYFCHEYISAVAQVRDDVYIAAIEDNNHVVGFFPFQRRWGKIGRPVGGNISDYHGIISETDFELDPKWLLKESDLIRWDFDHLIVEQISFHSFHRHQARSHVIDLSNGFESYRTARQETGTKFFKKAANLRRRLEREFGPIRFESHTNEENILNTCLSWKSKQYRQSGILDLFSFDWSVNLLRLIQQTHSVNFAGMLSGLWAGEQLIAAHMGMRSSNVWHYWFPSYDTKFSKYSPGQILLLEMAEFAPSLGVKAIDLGKGDSQYKSQLANSAAIVCEGCIELPSITNHLLNFTEKRIDRLDQSPHSPWLAQLPARILRKFYTWERCQ